MKQRSFAIFNKIKNVENAFLQLHRELEEGQIETDLSGTTCALIKIQNKCIESYNVGDSRAVLGRRESENGKSVLRPVLLTRKTNLFFSFACFATLHASTQFLCALL